MVECDGHWEREAGKQGPSCPRLSPGGQGKELPGSRAGNAASTHAGQPDGNAGNGAGASNPLDGQHGGTSDSPCLHARSGTEIFLRLLRCLLGACDPAMTPEVSQVRFALEIQPVREGIRKATPLHPRIRRQHLPECTPASLATRLESKTKSRSGTSRKTPPATERPNTAQFCARLGQFRSRLCLQAITQPLALYSMLLRQMLLLF